MKRENKEGGVTRSSFLKSSAGVAVGAAAIGVPAAAVLSSRGSAERAPEALEAPTTPNPQEPVVAYVRDAKRGEVTVVAGTSETTYRDPALVSRLLDAAPAANANGGIDVLAP